MATASTKASRMSSSTKAMIRVTAATHAPTLMTMLATDGAAAIVV